MILSSLMMNKRIKQAPCGVSPRLTQNGKVRARLQVQHSHFVKQVVAVIFLSFLLAGCAAKASMAVIESEVLLQENFEDADTSSFPSYGLGEEIVFAVADGSYAAIVTGGGYVWTLNNQTHSDVVIEVTTTKVSPSPQDTYGIICRAHSSNNGMGYYFMIDGNGNFGIRKGDGERVYVLVPWTQSDAINTGQGDENTLRAVCVDDYLAFYINGEFVAESNDSQYIEGLTGVVVATTEERVAIFYDNLTIREASISNE
ncbi:MAG: hypothetical protein Q9P01_07355 [Anaerolineae bacterium]|nr:hypothetical protein [Anaerolineae bacterium]MDQ7034642.1 hypothetical protein [Anaerolineae bacterium]